MRKVLIMLWLLVVTLVGANLMAAKDPQPPALSVEQKQSIQILAQRIELAQLRAQAAQTDFEKARIELTGLLQSLHKDGFDLDLQTLAYVPKKQATEKPAK